MSKKILSLAEIERLRQEHYNAEVMSVIKIHDELMILRVKPDDARLEFEPGQHIVVGLGDWEPRVAGSQSEELNPKLSDRLHYEKYW